jgi:hypothetical protein
MSEYDPLKELRDAGLLSAAPESHAEEGHKANVALEVLSGLTKNEVEVLKSVRARMSEAIEEEVGAHDAVIGGGLW